MLYMAPYQKYRSMYPVLSSQRKASVSSVFVSMREGWAAELL
jgi:hypothetical protein